MEGTTSLPNSQDDMSDSGVSCLSEGSLAYYVIRLTSCDKFSKQLLEEYLKGEPQFCCFVVGRETVPQEHYHLVVGVDDSLTLQDVKDIIRAFIVPLWSDPETHKLPRGFGNKQYNCQLSKDRDGAISYALKQKDYFYDGFTQEEIDSYIDASFEKKKPSNFKVEYAQMCDTFQNDDTLGVKWFMTTFIILKSKYGQQVRMSDAKAYADSAIYRRDPSLVSEDVDNYLSKY